MSKGSNLQIKSFPKTVEAKNLYYLLFTFIPGSEVHPPRSHPLLLMTKNNGHRQSKI